MKKSVKPTQSESLAQNEVHIRFIHSEAMSSDESIIMSDIEGSFVGLKDPILKF